MQRILYRCDNQGITAIIPQVVFDGLPVLPEGERLVFHQPPANYPKPIFTFAPDLDRHERWKYLTGTLAEMDRLVEGFEVREGSFYVPFSNGFEQTLGGARRVEQRFKTTLTDVFDHLDVALHARVERMLDIAVSASSRIK